MRAWTTHGNPLLLTLALSPRRLVRQGWTADDYEVGEKGAAGHFDEMVDKADEVI